MEQEIEQAIRRIAAMEACFDALCAAADTPDLLREDAALRVSLRQLEDYYHGGQWLADYTLDEQGMLPRALKRGVLSQDGVYDLLERIKEKGAV